MESANPHSDMSHQELISANGNVNLMLESLQGGRHGPIIFTHGFGQTRSAWRHSARALADSGWDVYWYDARGHGDSGRPDDGVYGLDDFVDDFRLIHQHILDRSHQLPIVVGASMGGLISMLAQGEQPQLALRASILVDITPRWEAAGVDRILSFMRQHVNGFSSLDEAREAVRDYLPHRKNPGGSLRHNLRQLADGRWYWHWDPRLLDHVTNDEAYQHRIAAAAHHIEAPTLLISGGQTDVISSENINELLQIIPHAEHVSVPKATHTVAGDDNDRFNAAINNFLDTFIQSSTDLIPEEA